MPGAGSVTGKERRGPLSRRSGGFISVGVVFALTAGLIATVLGAGALSHSLNVADGNIWLWSSKPGQTSRVNSNSGRVDMNQPLTDSRGHHVQITQNDKFLLLHDLDTGRVTSVDLVRMGFTGDVNVGKGTNFTVVLNNDTAAVIDHQKGIVRGLNPSTLQETKARLTLPGPVVGGGFDAHGGLWLGVPSQGTVVRTTLTDKAATIARSESALTPGHDMAVSVLDNGAIAVDRTGTQISVVTDKVHQVTSPQALSGAALPERTVGDLAAVTVPGAGRVVAVSGLGKSDQPAAFSLPAGVQPGAATPFAGRIYVPDAQKHVVYAFDRTGKQLETLGMAGAEGPLELEVREDHLMINAPDSSLARVVDANGVTRLVDKYQTSNGGNGDIAAIAAPAPGSSSAPAGGSSTGNKPGNNGAGNNGGQQQTGPPSPPIPVTALAGNHQVSLSWPASSPNGSPVQTYDVNWDGGHKTVNGDTRSLTVGNLHNGTGYSFSVTATNKLGTSPPALSEKVVPGSKQPDTPGGVSAALQNDGSVKLSWNKADEAARYLVRSQPDGVTMTVNDPSATSVVITGDNGVHYGSPYTFTVTAEGTGGVASNPSAPSNSVTPYGKPGAPDNVQANQTGTNTWHVKWGAAADNGSSLTGYVIKVDGNQVATPSANTTETDVPGSFSGSPQFSVAGVNKAGPGDPGTATGKPASKPTVTIDGADSDDNSITVKYHIDWGGITGNDCTLSVQGAGSANGCGGSLKVGNLKADTNYNFTVTATNSMGTGKDTGSKKTDVSTIEGTVVCNNTNGSNYCGQVGVYSGTNQQTTFLTSEADGAHLQGQCYAKGDHIYAYVYNQNKYSTSWIKVTANGKTGYIPYAWFNLAGEKVGGWSKGDDVTPTKLKPC